MTIKAKLLALAILLALITGIFYAGYLKGWYAHTEHINNLAAKKSKKVEREVVEGEQKAANATAEGKVIYRTVYRDVVKYVNDPNRTVCRFDDNAVQLRQRAIDAANNITGLDEYTVQSK